MEYSNYAESIKRHIALEIDDTHSNYEKEIEDAIFHVFQTYENENFEFLEKEAFQILLEEKKSATFINLDNEGTNYIAKYLQAGLDIERRKKFELYYSEAFSVYILSKNNISYLTQVESKNLNQLSKKFGVPHNYSLEGSSAKQIIFDSYAERDTIINFKLRYPKSLTGYFANLWFQEAPLLVKEGAKKYLFQYIFRDYEQAAIAYKNEKIALENLHIKTSKKHNVNHLQITEF